MNTNGSNLYEDLPLATLTEHAIKRDEGRLSERGALVISAKRPKSIQRYLVNEPSVTDIIRADALFKFVDDTTFKMEWANVKDRILNRERFLVHAHMGVDADIVVPLEMTMLKAWQAMCCHHLCHIPTIFNPREKPIWKVIWADLNDLSDCLSIGTSQGLIMIHVGKRRVLIAGNLTAGEMRRNLLTILGLLLPEKNTLPLHGAAAENNGNITLFLGPAGTRKTTWALRYGQLISDRGLSWSPRGLHRLADGCRLHLDHNLPIHVNDALQFGTIAENLKIDNQRTPHFNKDLASFDTPTHLIVPFTRLNATDKSDTRGPNQFVILAADPLGVLPPLAQISHEQALAWFILGYGNHEGPRDGNEATVDIRFTPGFMDTMVPRQFDDYLFILENLMEAHDTQCFLVNAGWHGGSVSEGEPLSAFEESAIISGMNQCTDWRPFDHFGLSVPAGQSETALPWYPRDRWDDKGKFEERVDQLKYAITEELSRYASTGRWLTALDLL